MRHIHAEFMKQYAEDAEKSAEPWEHWEVLSTDKDSWIPLKVHPQWLETSKYRRKLKRININGYEIPEPLREAPNIGDVVYLIALGVIPFPVCPLTWRNEVWMRESLLRGVIHTTQEAAELHARALLSFTTHEL